MRMHDAVMVAAGLALALFGTARLAAQEGKARCPVLGVEFQPSATTKSVMVNGQKLSFCCGGCPAKFAATPEKYVSDAGNCPVNTAGKAKVGAASRLVVNNDLYYFCCGNCPKGFLANLPRGGKKLTDPVSKKEFMVTADSPHVEVNGQHYYFASAETRAMFDKESAKYMVTYGK